MRARLSFARKLCAEAEGCENFASHFLNGSWILRLYCRGTGCALLTRMFGLIQRSFAFYIASAILLTTSATSAQARRLRPRQFTLAHGEVRFQCAGPTIEVPAFGRFSSLSSSIELDPTDLSKVSGHVRVTLASIVTTDLWWDELFRKAAFLELKKYPRSTFTLEQVVSADSLGDGKWKKVTVVGTFKLHGVSRAIRAQGMARWWPPRPFRGQVERIAVHLTFPIRWEDYKIQIPKGHPRTFTGDAASVQVALQYRPSEPAPVDVFRRKTK